FANSWLIESGHRMPQTKPGGLVFWCTDNPRELELGEVPRPAVLQTEGWKELIEGLNGEAAKAILVELLTTSRRALLECHELLNNKSFDFTQAEARQLVPALRGEFNAQNAVQREAVALVHHHREQSGR
ncbi:hypothetical protein, partial [Nonomuraea zeae]|uniref:hypothetical protein n=1 Tax=Nonomuraea zeae TaxID=1642303 RepID=UPI003618AECF